MAVEEFPDDKKNLIGDGFEEQPKAHSETAKTWFQAANVDRAPRFFEVAPPLSGAEGTEHFGLLQETIAAEVTPGPDGFGGGDSNPLPPRTNCNKAGKILPVQNFSGINLHLEQLNVSHLPLVGRLKHYLVNWQLMWKDRDPQVLKAVEGYQIHFINPPYQTRYPPGILHTPEESNLIESEIHDLLEKGAICQVWVGNGFVSNLFLVPK